ncbi:MAG: DNA mismatch repair endonuclease MutL [Thermoplasmata archaeon]|nr:DNA mismatch repair endonuclease MutL [Staphylococcus epidermidis]
MGKIKELDEKTRSLIAAGEVIERPANVVKELVENSIDANSKTINVILENGGKSSIIVIDDGEGMDEEDAILSIKKHTTSKITKIEDLYSLRTLGFRGEALFSIASVSRMEMWTGTSNENLSTYIYVEFGKIVKKEKKEPRKGTYVKVMDLFENLPARKKSLKSERIEFMKILQIMKIFELYNYGIHFTLKNNGKIIHDFSGVGSLNERFAQLYSANEAKQMVNIYGSYGTININGITSKPSLTRKNKENIFIYINSRFVQYDEIIDAIVEGYGSKLFHDLYPISIISINLPPNDLDVNIHPQKLKVKIIDEEKVLRLIKETISNSLSGINIIPEESPKSLGVLEKMETMLDSEMKTFDVVSSPKQKRIEEIIPDLGGVRIIGQIFNTYILCETPDSLLMVDQHAAHERVRTERLFNEIRMGKIQNLISPIVIEFSREDADILRNNVEMFEKMGFKIDVYTMSISVRSMPLMFMRDEAKEVIQEALDQIKHIGKTNIQGEREYEIISSMACKGAIKAHQKLSDSEMKELIFNLMKCENPYTCPHGRPTMVKIKMDEIEKMFKRRF